MQVDGECDTFPFSKIYLLAPRSTIQVFLQLYVVSKCIGWGLPRCKNLWTFWVSRNNDLKNEDLRAQVYIEWLPSKQRPRKWRPGKQWPRMRWPRKWWPRKSRLRKWWPRKHRARMHSFLYICIYSQPLNSIWHISGPLTKSGSDRPRIGSIPEHHP